MMATAVAAVTLPADYYWQNFELMLTSVAERYLDIFPAEQQRALQCYQSLPDKSKMLLVRLLSRKGEWFRLDKLHYREIGDIADAAQPLLCTELLQQTLPPLEIWFGAVTLAELKTLLHDINDPQLSPWRSKQQLWQLLQAAPQLPTQLPQWQQQQGLVWLQLNCQPLLELLLLLYFGNRYQDLSQFVLSDLGLQRFECYALTREGRAYQSSDELQTALSLAALAANWEQTTHQKMPIVLADWLAQLPAPQDNPLLERRRQKLLLQLGRAAERQQQLALAISLYQQSPAWSANERLCRCLEKVDSQQALAAVIALGKQAQNEAQQQTATRIFTRLSKQRRVTDSSQVLPPFQQVVPYKPIEISLALLPNAERRVELLTQDYFLEQGFDAWFSENSVLCGLFGLAFWDIIFAPIVGVFDNPYQRAPRDMYHADFVARRQTLITQRMAQLASGDKRILQQHFVSKQGLVNDWVNWQVFTEPLFKRCISNFSTEFLLALFQRILRDPAHYRSGHPDLLLFAADGAPQFVEVKGPGDKLADHQIHWLRFLADFYPAKVCYVDWKN
ncbi:VRR-NUC domain-containing protein [Shewanella dokdonensis]|uniref:phosphodiesterase I n=1 Tax=Shewanella dokdonensis TaxID=712036 RepID=A0ABX8DF20_9GAMM|nr:VRR-NUC domain-containing protein [Shewanella dokdonensis]MCL1073139.1 VRR-NUC domain-containing protein [Shewanella dokdonensis]QVK22985.1 VRR-NUC domain-containing protein [Shewanella dokdonensis]